MKSRVSCLYSDCISAKFLTVALATLLLTGDTGAGAIRLAPNGNQSSRHADDQGSGQANDQAQPVSQDQDSSSDKQQGGSDQSGAKPDEPEKPDKAAKNAPVPAVKLRIEVTNNVDKPVSNASVYVRFSEAGGFLHHDKLAELDLKTNQDGSVKVPPIPQGKILIQVIATGLHSYGKWYDIDKDEELVKIKLDPPPHWY